MSRVLVADDDAVSRTLLRRLLTKWGYDPEVVGDGVEAERALRQEDPPRLAILDWMMPGLDGVQVVRDLRAGNPKSYTYVLMLTSKGRKEDILEGMNAGVDDYLRKPFDAQELRARLRVGNRILDLEHKLICALEAAEHRATHDFLSGVYNRAAIVDMLGKELSRWEREQSVFSVCIVDVDHFKSINDGYGHLAGDEVLKRLAQCMKAMVRPYDSVGRYGGEEFLIIAPHCELEEAGRVAERIRKGVAAERFQLGSSIAITVSVGVSTVSPDRATVSSLLQAADAALYIAKEKGRDRVELARGTRHSALDAPSEAQQI